MASLPAVANDNDVERSGNCGRRSDWKLKLSPQHEGQGRSDGLCSKPEVGGGLPRSGIDLAVNPRRRAACSDQNRHT
jgi:hypothetical protein